MEKYNILLMKNEYNTLIVVDDNPAILTAMKICLAGMFERVLTMLSPDELIAALEREKPDAVLLDMNFSPGVNSGQDGLLWLRAVSKRFPYTPVVLITAYADIQLAVMGMKYGAADFITKPWDNDELMRKLRDAINRSRQVEPLERVEKDHVHKAVEQCNGNMSRAAEMLGITRQTLYAKMKK